MNYGYIIPLMTFCGHIPGVSISNEDRSATMFALLSCETLTDVSKLRELKILLFHWETVCASVEETANPRGPSFHFMPPFSSSHPQKMEAVDEATGRHAVLF